MLIEPKSTHKKAVATILLIAVFLGGAAFVHLFINKEKKDIQIAETGTEPVEMLLSGTYVCLPYKEGVPKEEKCDPGLQTEKGDLYSLDLHMITTEIPTLTLGDIVSGKGIFTPIERISSDYLTTRYVVRGIFSITDSLKIEGKEETTSNGTISFVRPSNFGLALNKSQITINSYIPPCDENFDYCLYYKENTYANTNFGSAGVRIKKRNDLTSATCLTAQPNGYTGLTPKTVASTTAYTLVSFPVGDAGMSHYANGELYRLAYKGTCHEFETRISATQFGVYEEGTKVEFKDAELKDEIKNILNSIQLSGGEKLSF